MEGDGTATARCGSLVDMLEHIMVVPRMRLPSPTYHIDVPKRDQRIVNARRNLAGLDVGEVYRIAWTMLYWTYGPRGEPMRAEEYIGAGWDPNANYAKRDYNVTLNSGFPDIIHLGGGGSPPYPPPVV